MLLVATDTGCSAVIVLGTQCSIRMQLAPIDCVHKPRDVPLIFASDRQRSLKEFLRLNSHSDHPSGEMNQDQHRSAVTARQK